MSPQYKAKELIEAFAEELPHKEFGVLIERDWATAKQCALIAVNEILNEAGIVSTFINYWQQVKQEIEKL